MLISSAPALDTSLFIHGELTRQITLHFVPGFYFEILGKKFDLELVDIPVPIPKSTKAWDFDPVAVHFPLPRIEAKPNPIDLGTIPVGQATSILVTTFDTGEPKLVIDASTDLLAIDTKHVVIPGGSSDAIRASITPKDPGPIDTTLILESNDPLNPKLSIRVTANAGNTGDPSADPNTEAAGGCGCRTAPQTSPFAWLLPLGLAMFLRRKR